MIDKIPAIPNNRPDSENTATQHWLMQRLTSIILIPLTFQMIVFVDHCLKYPYQETVSWLKSPFHAICVAVWFIIVFFHSALGLHVVIEDYIADQKLQSLLIKVVNGFVFLLASVAIILMSRIV